MPKKTATLPKWDIEAAASRNPRKRGEPAAMARRVDNLVKQVKDNKRKIPKTQLKTTGGAKQGSSTTTLTPESKGKGIYRRGEGMKGPGFGGSVRPYDHDHIPSLAKKKR